MGQRGVMLVTEESCNLGTGESHYLHCRNTSLSSQYNRSQNRSNFSISRTKAAAGSDNAGI